jgi:Spy/CpxP family protein refolding chaperone
MRPNVLGWALAAIFLMALAAPALANTAQTGQTGFPWWKDPKVVQELKLTPDQSTRIDNVFRAVFPQLRQSKEELDRLEAALSRLLEVNADEATVLRQVDKVEVVRGGLNKARTLMLLHMRKELTAKQNMKFNAVFEQYRRDNPRPAGPPPDASKPPPPDSKGRTPSR